MHDQIVWSQFTLYCFLPFPILSDIIMITYSIHYRTKRKWFPNVVRKTYYSNILGVKLQIRVTTNAIRCIDKAGGFDSYILHTPPHKMQSKLGMYLREEMNKEIVAKGITPPPVIKRYPRPPKSTLTNSTTSSPN